PRNAERLEFDFRVAPFADGMMDAALPARGRVGGGEAHLQRSSGERRRGGGEERTAGERVHARMDRRTQPIRQAGHSAPYWVYWNSNLTQRRKGMHEEDAEEIIHLPLRNSPAPLRLCVKNRAPRRAQTLQRLCVSLAE